MSECKHDDYKMIKVVSDSSQKQSRVCMNCVSESDLERQGFTKIGNADMDLHGNLPMLNPEWLKLGPDRDVTFIFHPKARKLFTAKDHERRT